MGQCMKKVVLFVFVLCVVAGCGNSAEVSKPEPVRPVRVFTTDTNANLDTRTYPGKVKAAKEASLAFRLSGQVINLDIKEGDYVEKGQLLALLDQRDYRAAVADLQAQLVGARSVLKEAKLNIDRNYKLIQEKIISQSSFDAAQSNYETSRARVLSLEQTLRRAKLNLQYTRLEAPFSGVVAKKHISNHEFIQAKEPIVDLEDVSSLDVVVDVPESVWVRTFNQGAEKMARMTARFESLPGKAIPLEIKEYQTNADPGTQTYEVTLSLHNAAYYGVHPGMTVEISGELGKDFVSESVSIPFNAVFGAAQGPQFVWVLGDDNTVEKHEITIGRVTDSGMTLVRSGVVRGDVVVMSGVHYLQEGQKVKVLEGRIGGRQ